MALGVMIDLGWPWWVSLIIALSVASACLVALIVIRHDVARGVLGLVVVQGVALAALSPFVMKDSDHSAAMAGPRLTPMEFAQRADANCQAFGEYAAKLGNPTTLPGIARQLEALMPQFWRSWRDQATLRPPAENQAVATSWMNSMASVGHDFEALHDAAKNGDKKGVEAANEELNRDSAESAKLSSMLGLKVCFH